MKHDFTSIIDRSNTSTIAVELDIIQDYMGDIDVKDGFSIIPMWIADMSFPAPAAITDEVIKRINHPIFGYFQLSDDYYNKIIDWQKKLYATTSLVKENIAYHNGVLGGVVNALNVLTSKGDNVLIHSPTYVGFTEVLNNNGYNTVHSPLVLDENKVYRMDYDDMERKIIENNIHVFIFCSPQNPTGRVWDLWEIKQALEICQRHDVYVISDEIWADLTLRGKQHIPTQSVSDDAKNRTIAMYAPSKTFNLAGFVGAYSVTYNKRLINRTNKEASLTHYNSPTLLSTSALIGAYSDEGFEWLTELRSVLDDNISTAIEFFDSVDGVEISRPEGTYLLLVDCDSWCKKNNKPITDLLNAGHQVGVLWQNGESFFKKNSIRMNIALPKPLLLEALNRLKKHVFSDCG